MINDGLIGIAMNFGKDLADEGARVNWKKVEEIDEKVTHEIAEKVAKRFAKLRAERRSQSYDTDTLHARGAEGLRSVMKECGVEPELVNTMVEYMELAFETRLEEAREGRRKMELLRRKTWLGGYAHAAHYDQKRPSIDRTKENRHGLSSRPVHVSPEAGLK